jgi:predicted metalloprotease with PDZ domain
LAPSIAREYALSSETKVVVVSDVDPAAPAVDAGLRVEMSLTT